MSKNINFYVNRSGTKHLSLLSSNDPKAGKEVRDFSAWNLEMVNLLTILIRCLTSTVRAWEEFQRKDIWYFRDGKSPTNSLALDASMTTVDKYFSKLKDLLEKLQGLKKGLCLDNPQGVSQISSFGS
jgi:hypothetical protein